MNSPEVLYSMAVLMTEMEDCKAQIQAFKLKKQSVPDDLAMKPDSYQMRIDFLMTQINFNLITADGKCGFLNP